MDSVSKAYVRKVADLKAAAAEGRKAHRLSQVALKGPHRREGREKQAAEPRHEADEAARIRELEEKEEAERLLLLLRNGWGGWGVVTWP